MHDFVAIELSISKNYQYRDILKLSYRCRFDIVSKLKSDIEASLAKYSIFALKMAAKMHDPESYNRIFILGAKNCTEDSLRDVFAKFGTVKDVYFVKDRRTEERKGSRV